jgi:hypothetical protein
MKKNKSQFVLVTEYPVNEYKCGLKAGDSVKLRKEIVVRDIKGKPTGEVHPVGDIWKVIPGSKVGRIDVWFLQANGKRCTWDDDRVSIDEWFEKMIK